MLATAAQIVAILGLLIGFVAGVLMYYFPAPVIRYTEKGEGEVTWVSNPTEEGKRKGHVQLFFSKLAPWLLAVAFLFQLPTVLLPLIVEVAHNTQISEGQEGMQNSGVSDTVVDCSYLDAGLGFTPSQAILKVSPKTKKALNLSFIPPRSGSATISESGYVLEFTDVPVFKERFTINRRTGEGWRDLVNSAGEVEPRDRSALTCKRYQGKPI